MAGELDPAALRGLLRRVAAGGKLRPAALDALARQVAADPVTAALRVAGLDPGGADERLAWFQSATAICPAVGLTVAGHSVRANLSVLELWRFYLPICCALRALAQGRGKRALVGITGPGAAGKSVFALLLQRVLAARGENSAICALDGFHYPNAYLDAHTVRDADGRSAPLRSIKGAPPSFDVGSFINSLRRLRAEPHVALPVYDRRLHDPVPDGIRIGPAERLALVEGNYLLLGEGRWPEVGGLLDVTLFLTQPLKAAREAMVRRFVAGGRTEQDARARYDEVDRRNYELIMTTAVRADLIVERSARQRVTAIRTGARRAL